jgi:hypothetical protein
VRKGEREREGKGDIQPVNNFVVRETKYEFVDHAIYAHCPANKLELRVFGIIEDKVIMVEICYCYSADAACHLS